MNSDSNAYFIVVFSLMMVSILYLSGCGSLKGRGQTGGLVCFGYCALAVANAKVEEGPEGSVKIKNGMMDILEK